jgi:hypothetical protein
MEQTMTKAEREAGRNEAMGSKEAHSYHDPRHGKKPQREAKKSGRKAKR